MNERACLRAMVVLSTCTMDRELQALMEAIEHRAPLDPWQQRRELLGTRGQNENGDTPLIWAARLGNAEAVAWLIGRGAGVDLSTDATGGTPLLIACGHGNVECVRLLLGAGASVDLERINVGNSCEALVGNGHGEVARLLTGVNEPLQTAHNLFGV